MNTDALFFMAGAWVSVLGLTIWCFVKLLKSDPQHEKLPPPGTSL